MTIEEYIAKLNTVVNVLKAEQKTINQLIGNEVAVAIGQRITQQQKKADGSSTGQYSSKPTLVGASSFKNKTSAKKFFGSGKKAKKDIQWRTVNGHHLAIFEDGYAGIRRLEGEKNAARNWFRTGQFWQRGYGIIKVTNQYVIIGGKTDRSKNIMQGAYDKSGVNLAEASAEELKAAQMQAVNHIYKQFEKAGIL